MADLAAWLTVNEAADRAGVNVSYIRRLCGDGILKAIKRGSVWFIDPDSLAEWESQRADRIAETTEQR
jgi:excisionase family DNA binding protein